MLYKRELKTIWLFPMKLHFHSIDPLENRYRTYSIDDNEPDLFNKYFLIIRWGRISCKGSKKTLYFNSQEEKEKELKKLIERRKKHGYILVE